MAFRTEMSKRGACFGTRLGMIVAKNSFFITAYIDDEVMRFGTDVPVTSSRKTNCVGQLSALLGYKVQ